MFCSKTKPKAIFLAFLCVLLLYTLFIYQHKLSIITKDMEDVRRSAEKKYSFGGLVPAFYKSQKLNSFTDALNVYSSPDKFIILAMADTSFIDMAINLYETSFRRHNITNFLFVGTGQKTCENLKRVFLPCYHYTDDNDSEVANVFNSPQFIRKMNIRTNMILEALKSGFTVLHTDLDVVFLQNPLPGLKVIIEKVDMAILWDHLIYNAGFLIIKPTNFSIQIYETTKKITDKSAGTDDQTALNAAIQDATKRFSVHGFKALVLDPKKYLCGLYYYETGHRHFYSKCTDCIVVHNNWIVSREAKIYRFKEHLTWMYDGDEYYSSKRRKYISYSNPILWSSQKETEEEELSALKSALTLGYLLNRIVILPRFHCNGKECALNSLLSLITFDGMFSGHYRENSFLLHPLVPDSVKRSEHVVPNQVIMTHKYSNFTLNITRDNFKILNVSNVDALDEKEIKHTFESSQEEVLKLYCLYRVAITFSNKTIQMQFEEKLKIAFRRKGYRQH